MCWICVLGLSYDVETCVHVLGEIFHGENKKGLHDITQGTKQCGHVLRLLCRSGDAAQRETRIMS